MLHLGEQAGILDSYGSLCGDGFYEVRIFVCEYSDLIVLNGEHPQYPLPQQKRNTDEGVGRSVGGVYGSITVRQAGGHEIIKQ